MKHSKGTLRYIGHRTLPDGGRRFDFSFGLPGVDLTFVAVDAPVALFTGPDHIAIQEGAGICYETLKVRVEDGSGRLPPRLTLTTEDVAEHRKVTKPHGRRH